MTPYERLYRLKAYKWNKSLKNPEIQKGIKELRSILTNFSKELKS